MVLPMHGGQWTFDDLDDAALPESATYEVSDGCLIVSPRPTTRHEDLVYELQRQLAAQCGDGWQSRAELTVRLGTDGRAADVGLLRRDHVRGRRVGYEPAEIGLMVEIVSPSSRKTDRLVKPQEYAEAGIPYFWRLEKEPALQLLAYRLVDDAYALEVEATGGTVAVPGPVPLVIDLDALD